MSDLIKDIEDVIKKHRAELNVEHPAVIRWIPICEKYADSTVASVFLEKGGETIRAYKDVERKVLIWLKVLISPTNGSPAVILSVEKP